DPFARPGPRRRMDARAVEDAGRARRLHAGRREGPDQRRPLEPRDPRVLSVVGDARGRPAPQRRPGRLRTLKKLPEVRPAAMSTGMRISTPSLASCCAGFRGEPSTSRYLSKKAAMIC